MSYDFKKINELELVNEVPEGANVLIETEGATKRLPSIAINNGYSKDEVYNKTETYAKDEVYNKTEADDKFLTKETIAKPDWNQNDPEAADYVKNRTHWEDEDGTVHKLDKKYLPDMSGGYDAVIDLGVFSDTTSLSDLTGGSVPAGTVKMIEGKIAAGEMPKLMGIITYQYYDSMNKSIFEFTAVGTYGQNQVRCYCDIMPYAGHYSLYAYLRDDSGTDTFSVTKL